MFLSNRRIKERYIKKILHVQNVLNGPYIDEADKSYYNDLQVNYFCDYVGSYLAQLNKDFKIASSDTLVGDLIERHVTLSKKFTQECIHFINVLDNMTKLTPDGFYVKAILLLSLYMHGDKQRKKITGMLNKGISCSMASIATLLHVAYTMSPVNPRYKYGLGYILQFNGHYKCAFFILYPYPHTTRSDEMYTSE
jgi:hypothetical protein